MDLVDIEDDEEEIEDDDLSELRSMQMPSSIISKQSSVVQRGIKHSERDS